MSCRHLAAKLRKLGPEHVDTLMAGMNLGTPSALTLTLTLTVTLPLT